MIEFPSAVLMAQATSPPASLRRQTARLQTQGGCSRTRSKRPLPASTGCMDAPGKLVCAFGGRYIGGTLAGHPHGPGQFYAPLGIRHSTVYSLKYDGDWTQVRALTSVRLCTT